MIRNFSTLREYLFASVVRTISRYLMSPVRIPAKILWVINERKNLGNDIVFGGNLTSVTNLHYKLFLECMPKFIIIHHKREFSLKSALQVLAAYKPSQ